MAKFTWSGGQEGVRLSLGDEGCLLGEQECDKGARVVMEVLRWLLGSDKEDSKWVHHGGGRVLASVLFRIRF
ncbi:hypothetical protein Tco_1061400 [Tanacetum coccineum]